MIKIKKLFTLPSPKDLGLSEINALPLRRFTPYQKDLCWEDFDKILKDRYPIKFFLLKTLRNFIKYKIYYPIKVPISTAWYWIICHLIPSRKYHFLDLRQPSNPEDIDQYRYGWIDVPEKMLFALFNLLKEYLDEEPFDLTTTYTREEIDLDPSKKHQQFCYDEAKAILHWWQVERKQEIANIDRLRSLWCDKHQHASSAEDPRVQIYWSALRSAEENFENKTDEMIARLMKIRRTLWV